MGHPVSVTNYLSCFFLAAAIAVVSTFASADQSKLVIDPFVRATPGQVNFPAVEFGQVVSSTIVVTNRDSRARPLYVSKLNYNCVPDGNPCRPPPIGFDDFTLSGNCGGALIAGASCDVRISFSPTGYGLRSSAVLISTDSAVVAGVPLSGQGPATPVPLVSGGCVAILALFVSVAGVRRAKTYRRDLPTIWRGRVRIKMRAAVVFQPILI